MLGVVWGGEWLKEIDSDAAVKQFAILLFEINVFLLRNFFADKRIER